MAEDKEADSPDESTSAARPEGDDADDVTDEVGDGASEEVVEEHVAPEDAREPTVEELEQLLESDDASPSEEDLADGDSDDEADDESDDDADGDRELVPVGASQKTAEDGAATKSGQARSKKTKATPKQKKAVEKPKRTTPVSFVKEAVGELRKVVYPTAPQLGNYFVVVLVFVLIIIGFVSVLDLGFGWLIVKVFS